MFGPDVHTPIAQLLNLKLRYMANDKNFLALDVVWDIYALLVHNIRLSRQRQEERFLAYPVIESPAADIVLFRNHMWNLKYAIAFCVVQMFESQLELIDICLGDSEG